MNVTSNYSTSQNFKSTPEQKIKAIKTALKRIEQRGGKEAAQKASETFNLTNQLKQAYKDAGKKLDTNA